MQKPTGIEHEECEKCHGQGIVVVVIDEDPEPYEETERCENCKGDGFIEVDHDLNYAEENHDI